MPLPRNKISLIHVAKSRLGLGDEDYRALLMRVAGVESSRDLDNFDFNQVMAEFQRLGFKSDFNKNNFGERVDRASPRQVALIRELWREFTNGEAGDKAFDKWLDKHFKISALRFLDPGTAPRVIAALKKMNERRHEGSQAHHS